MLGVGGIHQCLENGCSDHKHKKAFTKMQMQWEECVCEEKVNSIRSGSGIRLESNTSENALHGEDVSSDTEICQSSTLPSLPQGSTLCVKAAATSDSMNATLRKGAWNQALSLEYINEIMCQPQKTNMEHVQIAKMHIRKD